MNMPAAADFARLRARAVAIATSASLALAHPSPVRARRRTGPQGVSAVSVTATGSGLNEAEAHQVALINAISMVSGEHISASQTMSNAVSPGCGSQSGAAAAPANSNIAPAVTQNPNSLNVYRSLPSTDRADALFLKDALRKALVNDPAQVMELRGVIYPPIVTCEGFRIVSLSVRKGNVSFVAAPPAAPAGPARAGEGADRQRALAPRELTPREMPPHELSPLPQPELQ